MPDPIRHHYESDGVDGYYRRHGAAYRNPHEEAVQETLKYCLNWGLDTTKVLDLGCGSGEVTLTLEAAGVQGIVGCDPYTGAAYLERVGRPCEPWSFKDLARGVLAEHQFSLMIASYVLHLCPESLLPRLAWELSQHAGHLLILSPHKRPVLEESWGWRLLREDYRERVRVRLFERVG